MCAGVNRKKMLQIVLLLAAAAMVLAGILNGSMRDVWGKAATLCLECVGIG